MKLTAIRELDHISRNYAKARTILADRKAAHDDEAKVVARRHHRGIKNAALLCAEHQKQLEAIIEAHPKLFVKPRTMTLHGIKLGLKKGKGKTDWLPDAKVCELIRKHLPEQSEQLIQTIESPIKAALLKLDAKTLQKLGYSVSDTGDQIVIKTTVDDLDKFIEAILTAAKEEAA